MRAEALDPEKTIGIEKKLSINTENGITNFLFIYITAPYNVFALGYHLQRVRRMLKVVTGTIMLLKHNYLYFTPPRTLSIINAKISSIVPEASITVRLKSLAILG